VIGRGCSAVQCRHVSAGVALAALRCRASFEVLTRERAARGSFRIGPVAVAASEARVVLMGSVSACRHGC
jgi:hypothetical protein